MSSLTLKVLKLVPKNHLSRIVGLLAKSNLPASWHRAVIRWFVRRYRVNGAESAIEPEQFRTLAEFFVRDLKPGVRPVGEGVVSPVDGCLNEHGKITAGILFQVKGRPYTLEKLLGSEDDASRFADGYFMNFYLAPGDYHHIHSPAAGQVVRAVHIPGALWPVNPASVRAIPDLFAINERIISYLETDFGPVAVVKVGATNVGSIGLTYCGLHGNRGPWFFRSQQMQIQNIDPPHRVNAGDRLGTFHMGSSVVLLIGDPQFKPAETFLSGPIKYGVSLS